MITSPGDKAQAEALRIADEWLRRQGWKFTPQDIGETDREIIEALAGAKP